ncbi:TIM44-like domain-containing protein [Accumulibacter sp.]|uniref:Tim44 domain-containing protein n=1 Tax=Accumulibacter sp. TaxID=2053492 RepID=UPI0026009D50|nr:TIM44-like domain-containing protein [Accumulibacter sp.]MCP5229566.1 Tim44 domain-containing protein [Accumulibacter sp.]
MKRFFVALAVCALSFGLMVDDAEARRFGGGRSMGMQRQATPPPQRSAAAPASPAAPAAGAPKRNWMGPLAGLAAGLGIAALLSHFGLGEGMANLVMIALLALAAVFVFKLLFRRKAGTSPAAEPLRYAAAGGAGVRPVPPLDAPKDLSPGQGFPGAGAVAAQPAASIPADFDAEGFLRVAKLNFVRLQAANDAGNMEDIREFVSPEVFAEIKLQMGERGQASQQTDVVTLDAELLEVATEGNRHVASVRMSGMIREEAGAAAEPFDEIWNLSKPADGSRGWVVAGIQQVS